MLEIIIYTQVVIITLQILALVKVSFTNKKAKKWLTEQEEEIEDRITKDVDPTKEEAIVKDGLLGRIDLLAVVLGYSRNRN